MDYTAFCKRYYEANQMPLDLLHAGKPVYSSLQALQDFVPLAGYDMPPEYKNPTFCSLSGDILYGRVHVENTAYDIVLGPAFPVPVTDQLIHQYMLELMIPPEHFDTVAEVLSTFPVISQLDLARHMSLVYLCVNGQEADMDQLYEGMEITKDAISENQLQRMEKLDEEGLHSTYLFEIGMYEIIKSGQVERLLNYFHAGAKNLYEGRLGDTPLRHAKNLFITTVAKVCVIGAIPGGMEVEKAYQLTEYYIRECEKQTTLEAVTSLQYAMILDFCRRTGESKIPLGISADTFSCMNYIRSHVNMPLTVQDVADHIHRSESYVAKKFAAELGFSVNVFISSCRLEEAKSLLVYTEKSLAEISAYLCFSSQSYFQNVFKKKFGMTPMQFRNRGQRIE